MGKRELLLLSGFALVGILVYQLTMPASADTGGGFGAWWAQFKSHLQDHRVEARFERKEEAPVGADVRTIAVDVDRGTIAVVGEDRATVVVDLSGVVFGADDALAKRQAEQVALALVADGPTLRAAITLPRRDEHRRRPQVNVTLRVPSRLRAEIRLGGGELNVSDVAAVHLAKAQGRLRFANIAGAITGEAERGSVDVDRAGSIALAVRRCETRIESVAGNLELEVRRGELRARGIGGASTLDIEDMEGELEDAAGPVKVTGKGGELRVRNVRGSIDADTERTTLILSPAVPVPVTATTENDTIELTLPPGGLFLDAAATNGDVRLREGLLTLSRDEDTVKASGAVAGGGPRVQLRTSRGDIVVR